MQVPNELCSVALVARESVPVEFVTCFGGVFAAVIVFALIASITSSAISHRVRRAEFLQSICRRVNGVYHPAAFMRSPRIDFSVAGWKASIEFCAASDDGEAFTRVLVDLHGRSPGTLHVIPEGFGQSFLKMFGAQDLNVGDAEFDRDYVIKAVPDSLAGQIFSPERRSQVVASVRRLQKLTRPTLSLTRNELIVKVLDYLQEEDSVALLVRTAEEFVGFVFQRATPGIELGAVQAVRTGSCPVCGTQIDDRLVNCESCKTSHHEECWRYVGQCSTYACPEKRYVSGPLSGHDPGPAAS